MDLPPFPGFREDAFSFLRALKANNERDWFKPRKATYEDEVVWPMQCLVADLAGRFARARVPLTADPARAVFRIYRDVRFSKNKDPYKTHCGASLTRTGDKNDEGVLYLHVEPGASFMAAGFWQPDRTLLNRWRARMAAAPEPYLEIMEGLHAAGIGIDQDDTLKRLPRGFEDHADTRIADALRLKSHIAMHSVPDDDLKHTTFAEHVFAFTRHALPLLEYGWSLRGAAES